MKALLERKSIRKYKDQVVSEETVRHLLHAAMAAPSAANQQPWHFVVIEDEDILKGIASVHPYASPLNQAPMAIAVCASKDLGAFKDYWVQDCAAATQNILTACEALGLGAVWLGVYPKQNVEDIHSLLKLPESITPFSVISLGYPDEVKVTGDRYQDERVHWNAWGTTK